MSHRHIYADALDGPLFQKTYTADERAALEADGKAMPGGVLPIKTKRDLHNAVMTRGQVKKHPASEVKAHIIKRAKALNAQYMLPADWRKEMGLKQDARHEAIQYAMTQAIWQASQLLDFLEKHPSLDTEAFRDYIDMHGAGETDWPELQRLAREYKDSISQDSVFTSNGAACPTCGQALQVGVGAQSPDDTKQRFVKKPAQKTTLINPPTKTVAQQRMCPIVQINPVHWVITALVQSPDIPHLVTMQNPDTGKPEVVEITWTRSAIQGAAWGFLAENKIHGITMHHSELGQAEIQEDRLGEHGVVVESFVAKSCLSLERTDGITQHIPDGSWLVSIRADSPVLREAVLSGEVSAVSLSSFSYDLDWEDD